MCFEPESTQGRWGVATTDTGGNYALIQQADTPGLPSGTYKVHISTLRAATADKILVPERVPDRYNVNTELSAEIRTDRPNTFDFDLLSK